MTDHLERGAAEDDSGVPVTPTDVDASRIPPSVGGGHSDEVPDTQSESGHAADKGGTDASEASP
jgi:hypothetical protein